MAKTKLSPTIERTERELFVERVFDAPRELVFKAWSEPERLKQWWGPHAYPTTYCTVDFRPGGMWHYCMTGPNGEEAWGKAVYREILAPERIVYIDSFSDADGNIAPGQPKMIVTIEFTEHEGKTNVTSRAEFASVADFEAVLAMGMLQGLTETWDRLESYLAAA